MFSPGSGVIRVGDKSSHGGTVLTGQASHTSGGLPVAVVGDSVSCPQHGVCSIIEGLSTYTVNGKPVAFDGCATSCGAKLLSTGNNIHCIGSPTQPAMAARQEPPRPPAPPQQAPLRNSLTGQAPGEMIEPVFARSRTTPKQPKLPPPQAREPVDNAGRAVMLRSPPSSSCEGAQECTALSASVGAVPVRAGSGMTPLQPVSSPGLWKSIASGAGLLFRSANVPAMVALIFKPTSLGDGTLIGPEDLRGMSSAKTRLRFWVYETDQGIDANGIHIESGSRHEYIPVAHAEWTDGTRQAMEVVVNGITLTWTPNNGPQQTPPTALPVEPNATASQITVYPIPEVERGHNVADFPVHQSDWRDSIITFPADAGMAPLYIVLKEDPRQEAGIVTGYGTPVTGVWLSQSGVGDGSPIPTSVADALRGKEFSSFDKFREAFWDVVAQDQGLVNQFSASNQHIMRRGHSPRVMPHERAGKRRTFELHHVELVSQGGDVYNIDNLRVITPKAHINWHRGVR